MYLKKIDKIKWLIPCVIGGLYFIVIKKFMTFLGMPFDTVNITIGVSAWFICTMFSMMVIEQGLSLFSKKFDNDKEDD